MINAETRNSKYTSFLQRVHGRWKCIKTYIEHTFEQMDEIKQSYSEMPPLQGKSMIVLNEADAAKYQQNEVEPRELLSSSRKSQDEGFFIYLIKEEKKNEEKCIKNN